MRLEEDSQPPEEHFTEGELDLEPPEELALGELDDEKLLEEDLDNEDLDEADVDEVVLELTLDDLVHGADSDTVDGVEGSATSRLVSSLRPSSLTKTNGNGSQTEETEGPEELDDLEVAELEDFEESLDRILADRLAGDAEAAVEPDEPEDEEGSVVGALQIARLGSEDGSSVSPCREDEFVCTSCFLVRKRSQLSDPSGSVCRDCTT